MKYIARLKEMFNGSSVQVSMEFMGEDQVALIISPKLKKNPKDEDTLEISPMIIRGTIEEIENLDWSTVDSLNEVKALTIQLSSMKESIQEEVDEDNDAKEKKAKKKDTPAKSKGKGSNTSEKQEEKKLSVKTYDFSKCVAAIDKGNHDMAVYLVKQMIEKEGEAPELTEKLIHYEKLRENAREVSEIIVKENVRVFVVPTINLDDDLTIQPS